MPKEGKALPFKIKHMKHGCAAVTVFECDIKASSVF
jgi:hypothetical protein